MVLVVVICLQVLGLTAASRPLNSFLAEVFAYIPRLAAAAALLFVAWLVAKGLKFVVVTALDRTRLDEKLQREVEYQPPAEGEASAPEAEGTTVPCTLHSAPFTLPAAPDNQC
jgi:hypothetical protein